MQIPGWCYVPPMKNAVLFLTILTACLPVLGATFPLALGTPKDCIAWMAGKDRPANEGPTDSVRLIEHYKKYRWPTVLPADAPKETYTIYKILIATSGGRRTAENWDLAVAAAKLGLNPETVGPALKGALETLKLYSWLTRAWWNDKKNAPEPIDRGAIYILWDLMVTTGLELRNAAELMVGLVNYYPDLDDFTVLNEVLRQRHAEISPIEAARRWNYFSPDRDSDARRLDAAEQHALSLSPAAWKALETELDKIKVVLNRAPNSFIKAYLYAKFAKVDPEQFIALWKEMENRIERPGKGSMGPAIVAMFKHWNSLQGLLGQ